METQHYARVLSGFVVEPPIAFNPEGYYAPEIVATFVPCPADTRQGATYDAHDRTFANPPLPPKPTPAETAPPAEPAYRTLVSQKEYYGQFRPDEEALIRIVASEPVTAAALKAADAAERVRLMRVASLAVMLRRTDALAPGDIIDLADHQVEDGLGLLAQMELLEGHRPAEIRRGVPAVAG